MLADVELLRGQLANQMLRHLINLLGTRLVDLTLSLGGLAIGQELLRARSVRAALAGASVGRAVSLRLHGKRSIALLRNNGIDWLVNHLRWLEHWSVVAHI